MAKTTTQIIHGNCIDEMRKLPDGSIDLIFADPPYWMRTASKLEKGNQLLRPEGGTFNGCQDDWDNTFENQQDYTQFTQTWLKECHRLLSKNGSIWVIGSMQCIYTIGAVMQDLGFWFINDVVWHKSNPTPNFKGTRLNNSHETLLWASKSAKSKFTFHYKTAKELNVDIVDYDKGERRQLGSIWKLPICSGHERLKDAHGNKLHSTQKPEQLLQRIIALSSNVGDTILDPFGGTMTTATVAKTLGRNCISIEQESRYIQAGVDRVKQAKALEEHEQQWQDVAYAIWDIKPPKANMVDMIQAGFFHVGEAFYISQSDYEAGKHACLTDDGKLMFNSVKSDMHSLAGQLKGRNTEHDGVLKPVRLNGFEHWLVVRDNQLVKINTVRQNYRNSLNAKT